MSFHESSEGIRIKKEEDLGSTALYADCYNSVQKLCDGYILLDEEIGNSDGHFIRGGESFTTSAQNVKLEFRGDHEVPWLIADLPTADGGFREGQAINLAEHIANRDGNLYWVH